ncbi:hypothetical protein [Inquilinus sp. Marseille-Q2685]|nr:hypothetical protein [Inquilinus sp. Marseille-Q2685]
MIDEHRRIHRAIAGGAVAAAREAMRWHLLAAARRLGLLDEAEAARLR